MCFNSQDITLPVHFITVIHHRREGREGRGGGTGGTGGEERRDVWDGIVGVTY